MAEFNLRKNGEGYADPTPWKAFNEINEGEIYEYNGKEVLILRVQSNFCNILVLSKENDGFDTINVTSRCIMHTDPAMVSYAFKNKLGGFIKKIPDDEFETVLRKVEAALMLEIVRVKEIVNTTPTYQEKELKEPETHTEDCSIYKQLYEELLEKVMKKAFG